MSCRSQLGSNDIFYCEGVGDYWWVDLLQIKFHVASNPSQYVDIIFVAVWEGRVRFERDLRQDEASGPRDHWPTCEEVLPENEKQVKLKITN